MIARLLSSLLFTICLAGGAQAQSFWGTTANSCVPDDDTIKDERHKVNLASVQHAPDNLGAITLNCPVTRFAPTLTTGWRLQLTYRDSTGTGEGAFVRWRLYRMQTGTFAPALIVEANSNTFATTGNNFVATPAFTHSFDFISFNYWLRVDLDRSTTNQTVIFHSVALVPDD